MLHEIIFNSSAQVIIGIMPATIFLTIIKGQYKGRGKEKIAYCIGLGYWIVIIFSGIISRLILQRIVDGIY